MVFVASLLLYRIGSIAFDGQLLSSTRRIARTVDIKESPEEITVSSKGARKGDTFWNQDIAASRIQYRKEYQITQS